MLVSVLNAVVKLASRVSNQSALTSLYRSVELNKNILRCCSEFGNLAIAMDDTGLTGPVLLDASAVSAVSGSLPGEAELILKEKDGKILWTCGSATGRWNIVQSDHAIPALTHNTFPWKPADDFANALILASSACQAAAVSVGLYGIVLEPEGDQLRLISTNAVALASVSIDKGTFPVGKITLRPPVPGVLAAFISNCPNCMLDITEEGIFVQGDWLQAHLPISAPLQHDLKGIADQYKATTQVATINNNAVKQFITRARNLADKNAFFTVVVKVEGGKLVLAHNAIASSTEEWFLADGLNTALSYEALPLPADMLLVSLPHIKTVIFDYLNQKRLILRGTAPEFCYVISGGEN